MPAKKTFLLLMLLLAACCLDLAGCTALGIKAMPVGELEKKYTNDHSRFVEIDGARVHYRDRGSGPPLILLHGVMASLHTWDGWVEQLGDSYRIIRVDAPGHGLTGPVPGFTYDEQHIVAFLEKFVDTLVIDRFYLAGNSLGGYMAWNYAVAHPDRVRKLILLDPVGYPQKPPWIIRTVSLPVVGFFARHMAPRFVVAGNVEDVYGDPGRMDKSVIDRYHELLLRPGNRDAMVEIFRELKARSKDPDLGEEIKRLRVPTLLMWGEKDLWVPPEHISRWKANVPGLEVRTYADAGHIPMEELPEKTAREARKFLESGSRQPAGAETASADQNQPADAVHSDAP
ncbi:MAG: alpha/beta hydrolase [Desulfobacteraceae bacterium]|nr:alpha/beta hydrolase [Desulfobacteraceae bacterium]